MGDVLEFAMDSGALSGPAKFNLVREGFRGARWERQQYAISVERFDRCLVIDVEGGSIEGRA